MHHVMNWTHSTIVQLQMTMPAGDDNKDECLRGRADDNKDHDNELIDDIKQEDGNIRLFNLKKVGKNYDFKY